MEKDIIEFVNNIADMIDYAKEKGSSEQQIKDMTEALNTTLRMVFAAYESE